MSSQDPTQPGKRQEPPVQPPETPATPPQSSNRPKLPPVSPRVSRDASNMPLPQRVPERDPHGTRVSPRVGLDKPWDPQAGQHSSAQPTMPNVAAHTVNYPAVAPSHVPALPQRNFRKILFNTVLVIFALGVLATILVSGYVVYEYVRIARTLPDPSDISARASQFQSTFIYDSTGQLLYELNDPNNGRRTSIPLDQISPYLIAATIATEDGDYYNHPGFDVVAITKAVYRAWRYDTELTGASTITQQLTRALYLRLADCDKPDAEAACYERSFDRKLREIILAAEINRTYTKDEILQLYLNEIYYGNLAYGIEAASKTYFNKDAKDLTLAEASFLAGLPQSPAIYDVYTDPELTFNRQGQVLLLMRAASGDCNTPTGGIEVHVGGQSTRVCVTDADVAEAAVAIQGYAFTPPVVDTRYPHWVNYIRQILETQFGPDLYRGYRVYTTLNPALQDVAEAEVKGQVDALATSNVTDGALIAMDPRTGHILAMVGSDSYEDPADGQINMAIRPRQPGSSIKTLTYVAAFEKGWTPATLVWDIPTDFPDGANAPYAPRNYDGRFHGPVLVRDALANSYNIPAVRALQYVGIYDNPDTPEREGLIAFAERLGITSFTRPDYGLSLTLGGGDVTLLEMTNAYGILANGGTRITPIAITKIEAGNGTVICEQPTDLTAVPDLQLCQTTPAELGQSVVGPEHAFLISDILSDNHARSLAFGPSSALALSFPAAVKTGTTNDYRDNWTMGYTPNLVVGVWVGNADFTPMAEGVSGVTGAGPIWHNVMEKAWTALGQQPQPFTRPAGVVNAEICVTTGAVVNDYCRDIVDPKRPNEGPTRQEVFAANQLPVPPEQDVVIQLFIDTFSGMRASPECNNDTSNTELKTFINISDAGVLRWLEQDEQGRKWAEVLKITFPVVTPPTDFCTLNGARPIVTLVSPSEGQTIDGIVDIYGIADVTSDEFDRYVVDWGIGNDPQGWGAVSGDVRTPVRDASLLARWDTASVPNGEATLRLTVFDKRGGSKETRVHIFIQHPDTPTPVPSDTAEPPTETATATPTATQEATATASATLPVPTEIVVTIEVPTLAPTETTAPTATTGP
jgi:membrane peptidoglycan carboxypeptidase